MDVSAGIGIKEESFLAASARSLLDYVLRQDIVDCQ